MSDCDCLKPQLEMPVTARGIERRKKILTAAKEVFLEQGFESASIAEITRRAGGSMSTLYRMFGNKMGLFQAMMQECSDEFCKGFEGDLDVEADPETSLLQFGRHFIELVGKPELMAVRRVAIEVNGEDAEELRRVFFDTGPRKLLAMISEYFEAMCRQGVMQIDDCDIAAAQFVELIKQPWYMQLEYGFSVSEAHKHHSLQQGVAIFLGGVLVR